MDKSYGSFYDHKYQKDKLGPSSLKIFDGEDLSFGDRKKMQSIQQKEWIDQQVREKQDKNHQNQVTEQTFAEQTLELNRMRKALEDEYAFKKKTMEKAYLESNKQLAQQKADQEKLAHNIEEQEKQNHIEYNTNHDFYTENPETCQSHVSSHRVLKYHWKGMNENQRDLIRAEQEKQRKEAENIKKFKEEEEKLMALQAEHQRKMQIQLEREKQRRKEELLRNQKEFNLLKNEEQKIKIKTMYG